VLLGGLMPRAASCGERGVAPLPESLTVFDGAGGSCLGSSPAATDESEFDGESSENVAAVTRAPWIQRAGAATASADARGKGMALEASPRHGVAGLRVTPERAPSRSDVSSHV
jgi:hypothetical protein